MAKPNISVLLHPQVIDVLGPTVKPLLKSNAPDSAYLLCKRVESGHHYYLHMVIELTTPDGPVEMELQIPHQMVKAIISAVDPTRLGFAP